jgi:hypothetical protein
MRGAQTFVAPPLEPGVPVDQQTDYQQVQFEMMGEMWLLATAGLHGMGTQQNPSTSFLRYFDATQFCNVQKAFQKLLGAPDPPIEGPPELAKVTVWWDDTEFLNTHYTEYPWVAQRMACALTGDQGWSAAQTDIDDITHNIIICPRILNTLTKLNSFDCNSLTGHYVTGAHRVRGQTMFHELIHWNFIGKAVVGQPIPNFTLPPDSGELPLNGYDPYNAMQVNKLHRRGHLNADSYSWYAMEALLLNSNPAYPHLGCGGDKMDPRLVDFNNPPDPNDPTNRASDLLISPSP